MRVLLVEDSADDGALVSRALEQAGYAPTVERVSTPDTLAAALQGGPWDVIISAYRLPAFGAPAVLALIQARGLDVPLLVVSGMADDAAAAAIIRAGARDYVPKDNLTRLGAAVERELREAQSRRDLQRSRERLRDLSRRLLEAQEAERRAIARGLHDDIGQLLTAVKLNLQTLEPARLHDSLALVDQAIQAVRSLSLDLRPSLLDDLGLAAALRSYLGRQARRAGFAVEVDADDSERLPPAIETAAFRLVQEAVTNVARHAGATRVRVSVRRGDGVVEIGVHDDGAGFDVARALAGAASGSSLGLLGMDERVQLAGGELSIESAPGRGTAIRARFPLRARAEHSAA